MRSAPLTDRCSTTIVMLQHGVWTRVASEQNRLEPVKSRAVWPLQTIRDPGIVTAVTYGVFGNGSLGLKSPLL